MRFLPLALALLASSSGFAADPPAIANYCGYDLIERPALSPDGTKVAYLTSAGADMALAIFHLDTGKGEIVCKVDPRTEDFTWKGNDRILYAERFYYTYYLRSVAPGAHALSTFAGYGDKRKVQGIFDWLPGDDGHVLVINANRIGRMDVATGAIVDTQPTDRLTYVGPYLADATGVLRLRCVQWASGIELQHRQSDAEAFTSVYRWSWDDPVVNLVGFGADPNVAYFCTHDLGNWSTLRAFDTRTHAFGPSLASFEGAEFNQVYFDQAHARVIGMHVLGRTSTARVWLDPKMRRNQATIDAALPGRRNEIESWSSDLDTVVFLSTSGAEPGTYYSLNLHLKSLRSLERRHPAVDPARIGKVAGVEITARDGLKIHAVLTLPPGGGKGPFPLVVLPQDRAFNSRSTFGYDPFRQSLASLGYAVLNVDYRGSWGYGKAYEEAGYHQLTGKIPEDIADATQWAVKSGYATAGRIAVMGSGFGATLALMAATQFPDLFSCVINDSGEPDLTVYSATYEGNGGNDWLSNKNEERLIGADMVALRRSSPLTTINSLNGPVLNMYGERNHDLRLGKLEFALKQAGKTGVEFKTLPPDAERPPLDYRINYYRQIEDFLGTYLKPVAPVAANP